VVTRLAAQPPKGAETLFQFSSGSKREAAATIPPSSSNEMKTFQLDHNSSVLGLAEELKVQWPASPEREVAALVAGRRRAAPLIKNACMLTMILSQCVDTSIILLSYFKINATTTTSEARSPTRNRRESDRFQI
jgi:hypothetical protein